MKTPFFHGPCGLLPRLGLLLWTLLALPAFAQQGGTIVFTPVRNLYTANPYYLATNVWQDNPGNVLTQLLVNLRTPTPNPPEKCPDFSSIYYGDAAKMTGLAIPVTPNTYYTITTPLYVIPDDNPSMGYYLPMLSFKVNERTIGLGYGGLTNQWVDAQGTWFSGSNTSITSLGVWNDQGSGCGNDFYLIGAESLQVPTLSVSKTASANPMQVGSGASFTITASIAGGSTTTPISVTDNLPSGLTLSATPSLDSSKTTSTGAALSCTSGAGATTASCTLASGAGIGNIAIRVPVNVGAGTAASITNMASLTGGTANCTSSACTGSVSVNVSKQVATLTLRQILLSPVPATLVPPYKLSYSAENGWLPRDLANTALNSFVTSDTQTLANLATDTRVWTNLPESHYFVNGFSCTDTSASASGNPAGTLVSAKATSLTIPAANVRAGANLRCTMLLGHYVP